MAERPFRLLRRLERAQVRYGGEAAARKRELLRALARRRLASAGEVLRLHESLCFLRAFPDDRETLAEVDRLLQGFDRRGDLRRHHVELADSGIAGTEIRYRFYWATARWLAERWPRRLAVDWPEFERQERLLEILHLLMTASETPALDQFDHSASEWVRRLKGPEESDAAFLVRRFREIDADDTWKEKLYEDLDLPIVISPGPDTPSRSRARYRPAPVHFQTAPLVRSRPDLRRALSRPPLGVRELRPAAGARLIDLAREAMVTRSRDLDAFANADRRDVRLVDCGEGLQLAMLGTRPERRLLLESVYGFLTLKNGVPIGYALISALFASSEIAYNVFESFRGAESARIFGRILAVARHLFGSDHFSIDPYQLGLDNEEGLASGAWWFYYKLGFRPDDAEVRRVLRQELRSMKRDPSHRSGPATLRRLAAAPVFWHIGRERRDVLGRFPLGEVGLEVASYLARRFGSARREGLRTCAKEVAQLLGVRSFRGFSAGERTAWRRWSPLVLILPGIERWSRDERRALAAVMRAKGGRRESEFVALSNRHRRLRRALNQLTNSLY